MMRKARPAIERVWPKILKGGPDDCWIWTGAKDASQYGHTGAGGTGGRTLMVHRVVYESEVGAIPQGLQLDHLCHNPPCCNPRHLEPVTASENNRRKLPGGHWNAQKTHCKRGHEFTPERTFRKSNGGRECRECHNLRNRERYGRAGRNR